MKTNKLDKSIKEKFVTRTIKPSTSAWERLSAKLDEQPKQKKKSWFFYASIAASILLVVSIGFQLFTDTSIENQPIKEIIVNNPIDKNKIDAKIDNFIEEKQVEKSLVNSVKVGEKPIKNNFKASDDKTNNTSFDPKKKSITIVKDEQIIANVDKNASENKSSEIKKEALQQNPNSRIKINSDDLLYAVTHNQERVKTNYAKNNLTREDVLRTIKSELKKSNIKIDAETILAEVERTIDDDYFQNNFMNSLKNKISDFATVIASRNH
jgi:hypothetical protein